MVLQRPLDLYLQLDRLDPLLLDHPLNAFLHEEVIGGQGTSEQLVVLVGHLVRRDLVLEQGSQA